MFTVEKQRELWGTVMFLCMKSAHTCDEACLMIQRISDGHPRLREVLMAGLAHSLATAPTPAQDLW